MPQIRWWERLEVLPAIAGMDAAPLCLCGRTDCPRCGPNEPAWDTTSPAREIRLPPRLAPVHRVVPDGVTCDHCKQAILGPAFGLVTLAWATDAWLLYDKHCYEEWILPYYRDEKGRVRRIADVPRPRCLKAEHVARGDVQRPRTRPDGRTAGVGRDVEKRQRRA